MSIIEGIGDEVTIFASVLILATTLLFAWFSTFVSERASLRTTSPNETTGTSQEDADDSGIRIDEPYDIHGIGNAETEIIASSSGLSESGTGVSNETENADSEPGLSQDGVGSDETDNGRTKHNSESQQNSTVDENSSPNVIRNRVTGQTADSSSENSCNTFPGSTTNRLQTLSNDGIEAAIGRPQLDQLFEESTSDHQASDQADEPTPGNDHEQAPEGSLCIRIKYLTDRERVVYADPTETLGHFRQRAFSDDLSSGQMVRLIFNGQLLQDDGSSLTDLNITHNCVIHCLLSQNSTPSDSQPDVHEADVDLGRFMVPLFTCILGFVWYLRWQYRYMFNATSTLSLIGVTSLFVLAVLASWRG